MERSFGLCLLICYTAGVLVLPGGDLGIMAELPAMYRQCKATEHHDMTLLEFVTDHLLPFDSMVDPHPPGDQQRPHKPMHHRAGTNPYAPLTKPPTAMATVPSALPQEQLPELRALYHFDPLVAVFRPPNA